jgi:hypothetical protein
MGKLSQRNKASRMAWYESNGFWGPLGIAATIIFAVVAVMISDLRWILWFAWPCSCLSIWAIVRNNSSPKQRYGYFTLGVLFVGLGLYTLSVKLEPEKDSGLQLTLDGIDDLLALVPQTGQRYKPKVSKFARVRVKNTGKKKVDNVRVNVMNISGLEVRWSLPVASWDNLFVIPNPSLIEGSVDLNPGDEKDFDALVECNGQICPQGQIALPHLESGKVCFAAVFKNEATYLTSLRLRVSSDNGYAMTKTFTISLGTAGQLVLKPQHEINATP